jgi:hypothetical protein
MILRRTVFDLGTFSDVNIGIEFTPSPAFGSLADALKFFGNDESAVLAALNGVKAENEEKETLATTPISEFRSFADEDETELNGPAEVQIADDKTVNDLILSLAKQHFGFENPRANGTPTEKAARKAANKAAKDKAMEFIKTNDALRQALVVMSSAKLGTM